jgi:hypothetical protein
VTAPLSPAQRQRLRSPANLWRALIPLVAIVTVLVIFTWPRGQHADGIHVVDVAAPVAAARQQAGFGLTVPTGLGPQWRPTSTEFLPAGPSSGASFRIGYVSPSGKYAEFLEGDDQPDAVSAQYGPLTADGSQPISGANWQRYRTGDGHQLLRHTTGKVTAIVTGTAGSGELVELAAAVR